MYLHLWSYCVELHGQEPNYLELSDLNSIMMNGPFSKPIERGLHSQAFHLDQFIYGQSTRYWQRYLIPSRDRFWKMIRQTLMNLAFVPHFLKMQPYDSILAFLICYKQYYSESYYFW